MILQPTLLSELAHVRSGGGAPQDHSAFSTRGHPFIRAGSLPWLLEHGKEDGLEKLEPSVAKAHRLNLFPAGTVLFAKSGMSATKGHIYRLRTPCYVVNHLAALVPHNPDDSPFLTHALQRFPPSVLIKDAGYPSIRLGDIEAMKILAPINSIDRRRIAEVLDAAEAVRASRRYAITQADSLNQAIFLAMFGDPIANPKGFPAVLLSDIADLTTGYPFRSEEYVTGFDSIRLLRGANVLPGRIDWSDMARWPNFKTAEFTEFALEVDDVVVAMDRPWISSGFKIARIRAEDCPSLLVQRVARLRGKGSVPSEFIYELLRHEAFARHCRPTETTIPHISPRDIRSFKIPLPPTDLLKEYVSRIRCAERIRAKQRTSLSGLDTLFDALQYRAFRGEL